MGTQMDAVLRRIATGVVDAPRWQHLLILVALAAFYTLTAAGNLSETDDAYAFAYRVERFPLDLVTDPRLLGYHTLARLVWLTAQALGTGWSGLDILRGISVIGATGCLWLVTCILVRDLGVEPVAALLAGGLLAFFYGFWRYAAEADVYVAAMLCCAWVLHRLLQPDIGWRRGAALGACAGAAVLFYQPNAIPLFLAFPFLLLKRGFGPVIAYCMTGGLVAAAGYITGFLAYWPAEPGREAFLAFMSQRSQEFMVPPLSPRIVAVSAIKSVFALGHDMFSSNWVFGLPHADLLVQRIFSGNVINEEVFTARQAGALVYVPLFILPLLAGTAWRVGRAAWPLTQAALCQPAMPVLWGWVALVGLVNGRLNPAGIEAWIVILLPLTLIIASVVIAPACARLGPRTCALLLALLAAHNTVGGMALVANGKTDLTRLHGLWVIAQSRPGDLVVTVDDVNLAEYLRYLGRADVLNVRGYFAKPLAHALLEPDVPIVPVMSNGRDFAGRDVAAAARRALGGGGRVIVFDSLFLAAGSVDGRFITDPLATTLKAASREEYRSADGHGTYVFTRAAGERP